MFEQVKNHTPKCINLKTISSVLIPLIQKKDGYHVLFEVRSKSLKKQPGEICFPGGRMEKDDENTLKTAIRETCEELMIEKESIQIIGPLDYYMNINGMRIDAYLAELKDYSYTFNEEVQSVFTVPLYYFLENEPNIYYNKMVIETNKEFPFELISGNNQYKWANGTVDVPFYQYEDKIIWGLTARLLYHNLKYLKK